MPKPRMTRSDKWKKRPVVVRYRAWCDRVRAAYMTQCGQIWGPVALSFTFFGTSKRPDLSNLIKAIEDALTRIAWTDDNVTCIVGYDRAWYFCLPKGSEEDEGLEFGIRELP